MKILRVIAVLLLSGALAFAAPENSSSPIESPGDLTPQGPIDQAVFAHLKKLGLAPAPLCSDPVFVRRAYLDIIGTLPTGAEARAFIQSQNPDKRRELIDQLLARDEFADYWANKWCDVLRVKAEFPINLWPNAAQAYHQWILTAVRNNRPADQFARDLLTASGSDFRVGPVNFYRAMQNREPEGIAQTVALTFMGARADQWPAAQLAGLAGFFAAIAYKPTGEWKEEIVFFDPARHQSIVADGYFPRRPAGPAEARSGSRAVFADWLIDQRIPGSPATSPTASGFGCWGAGLFMNRTTSGPTTRPATRNCWPAWNAS